MLEQVEILNGLTVRRSSIYSICKTGPNSMEPFSWVRRIRGKDTKIRVVVHMINGTSYDRYWSLNGTDADKKAFDARHSAYRMAIAAWIGPDNMAAFDLESQDRIIADQVSDVFKFADEKKPLLEDIKDIKANPGEFVSVKVEKTVTEPAPAKKRPRRKAVA